MRAVNVRCCTSEILKLNNNDVITTNNANCIVGISRKECNNRDALFYRLVIIENSNWTADQLKPRNVQIGEIILKNGYIRKNNNIILKIFLLDCREKVELINSIKNIVMQPYVKLITQWMNAMAEIFRTGTRPYALRKWHQR